MDEQLQEQVIQLIQAAQQGDQEAQQTIQQIMQAAQQGDQQAMQIAQMIQTVAEQMQGQAIQAAKFGAKLNYIRSLRGLCPEGCEMQYFKKGGQLCKKCVAKQNKKKLEEGGTSPVDAFKCGRKMKKVKKAQSGNQLEYEYSEWDNYNGDGLVTSETLKAKPGFENNKQIGDRTVYRWIEPGDTNFVVYPHGGFYGWKDPNTPAFKPIAIYDKTTPNYRRLQSLFDKYKNQTIKEK